MDFIVEARMRIKVQAHSAENARSQVRYMDFPELKLPDNMELAGVEIDVLAVTPLTCPSPS